ncbi:hypothetical protein [Mesorhizobium humile]|uniref:Uncharacterized protein n=1 Tax=Mesorhizobium humile TaxID=3072313 RepID=A0ABU4YCL9_9HYPH|nr:MULTISPECIES: hypothetical protein [unclassified Mesorhizobium]MDX8458900.1 hypothetical protein [Mesorhizobium sp. VK2D]MDX8484682.1 hypothetical protein [Mesorhizobium sp. VK2B]
MRENSARENYLRVAARLSACSGWLKLPHESTAHAPGIAETAVLGDMVERRVAGPHRHSRGFEP